MNRKSTVTVGIPAYNEEANIGNLLKALLSQKRVNFIFEKIIVVSDASTDGTAKTVKSFKNTKIVLLENRARRGQAQSQNKILENSNSDILVLLNADVLPFTKDFLNNIVRPFDFTKNIGIVGGLPVPVRGSNQFEKVINYSVRFKNLIYKEINGGNNIYLCHGRVRAFSRKFYSRFRWGKTYAEDAYSYLSCKSTGFEFYFEPRAKVSYRSPSNLRDHLKQSTRFLRSRAYLKNFFDKRLIDKEYPGYKSTIVKRLPHLFLQNPILFILYLSIYLTSNIYLHFSSDTNISWSMASTTKKI